MAIFVKSMTMISAEGGMGPMVLLFAHESLEKDQFVHYECVGLTHIADPSRIGYICFCHSRQGNKEFFRWYLKTILCNYVKDMRASSPECREMYAFVSSDGEQLQVNTFSEQESLDAMDDAMIIEAKHSASYSAKGNALGAGKYLMATKARLKFTKDENLYCYTRATWP
jgi:hypothetical protein